MDQQRTVHHLEMDPDPANNRGNSWIYVMNFLKLIKNSTSDAKKI
jgi:hypothetical protein